MTPKRKREFVYLILSGIFITNAVLAELIGGKLIQAGPAVFSLGVLPWPVVFVTTDLINEYFGRKGVRNLSIFTALLVSYAFLILFLGILIPAVDFSPVKDEAFANVFGQSLWIIGASIVAFMTSQMVDVMVFWMVRERTDGRFLWARATGSTAVSQLVDTFIIMWIAFYLPSALELIPEDRRITFQQYLVTSASNYGYKLAIAVALTPIIYLGHGIIDRALGKEESEHLIDEAARSSLSHK
ncbi:MAG: queuosine precursor transporter [Bdellovibrionales bacterium]|nr:queuosine precursor transporter [Bdellovibrionales bacterium]